jgi:GNAT superfamily N-acetyltransferase
MIRPARDADIPRLMQIRAAVRENRLVRLAIGADDYRPYVADGRCWVCEQAGAVQGFAALDADAASVWALFVAPEAEGRGLGGLLLDRLIDEGRARGLAALSLDTEAGTRADAFYRSRGFTCAARDGDTVRLTRAF